MPRYDFECHACRGAFEVRATVSEYAALQRDKTIGCPSCGSRRVLRVFSPPNLPATPSTGRRGGPPCCAGGKCR